MKNVVCMKWGTLYGPEYVNKLYAMVKRNITGPFRFVCLTDDAKGINSEVEIKDCPSIDIDKPHNNRGWRKVTLWNSSIFLEKGDWLYLDLDVVVTDSIDAFFEYAPEKSFIVMQNWTQPGKNIGNTSVYRFRLGEHDYLFHTLMNNHREIIKEYVNSQTYISRTVKEINFWPDDWCVLFKVQCVPSFPLRIFKEPVLPDRTKVVAFPGVPNPHEALQGIWPTKKWYKKIYKTIKPTKWIKKYWRE